MLTARCYARGPKTSHSLGASSFQASSGRVHQFKARHGLIYKSGSGEGKKVDEAVVNDWMGTNHPAFTHHWMKPVPSTTCSLRRASVLKAKRAKVSKIASSGLQFCFAAILIVLKRCS